MPAEATPLPQIAVTVSSKAGPDLRARARAQAAKWGVPFFDRPKKRGLARAENPFAAYLMLRGDGWVLRDASESLRFTPGMAQLRIKRWDDGDRDDVLVTLAQLKPGDEVLDCTFGLGADSLVCAHVVGKTGCVLGLEKSFPLAALAQVSVDSVKSPQAASIKVEWTDAASKLRTLPNQSFDVVLFDPMFAKPQTAAPHFSMFRRYASHDALTTEMVELARRVARRFVLIKGSRYSDDFKKLGVQETRTGRVANVMWARVNPAL
ncbi:MAG: class I SAM-dependent methyltransferase [Myxococcaceae bacterium]|nr:class I SAM-dependent methyltransferase [Myxococcaceae bacterium]